MSLFIKSVFIFLIIGGENYLVAAENKVFTTIYPIYTIAKDVGKSVCEVENLIPAGANPHDYQIKPGDLAKLHNSSLVFICGLGLDEWFEDVISRTMNSKRPQIITITKGIENFLIYESLPTVYKKEKTANPHFWHDPFLMKVAATNVAVKLKDAFPEKKGKVEENLINFAKKMDEVDMFISDEFSKVAKRPIICMHNAFAYFGKRYAIEIAGVIEETPDFPVSPQRIGRLISIAREKGVVAVFGEIGGANDSAKRLSEELGLPFALLDTLETGDGKNVDYVQRMKTNAMTIMKFMK